MSTVDVIIPTYKPGERLLRILDFLEKQTIKPSKIILMNTEESLFNDVAEKVKMYSNVEVHHVTRENFDHGKTRAEGVSFSNADFFLCLTDDAIPTDKQLIEKLLMCFEDSEVVVAYGRQLPGRKSSITEKYTRKYNYPEFSCKKTEKDIEKMGIKAFFCSNACAMYRRSTYNELGGFIDKTIFNEDMIFAHAVLLNQKAIYYQAEATVIHSHKYDLKQQFKRNFDLGVSHAMYPEIFLGMKSESEGMRMVKKVSLELLNDGNGIFIPYFFLQCAAKLLGYKTGRNYKKLSKKRIHSCTMNQNFWL